MIRLKDMLVLLSKNSAITEIVIMTKSGNRLYQLQNTLGKEVLSINFTRVSNFAYSCTLTISFIDIGYSESIEYLRFSDIEKCIGKDTIILPVDSKYNKSMIQEACNLTEYYESEVVETLVPIFTKEYMILQVILSDKLIA